MTDTLVCQSMHVDGPRAAGMHRFDAGLGSQALLCIVAAV